MTLTITDKYNNSKTMSLVLPEATSLVLVQGAKLLPMYKISSPVNTGLEQIKVQLDGFIEFGHDYVFNNGEINFTLSGCMYPQESTFQDEQNHQGYEIIGVGGELLWN